MQPVRESNLSPFFLIPITSPHVTLHVLLANVMEDTHLGPLYDCVERLGAIVVDLASDVLSFSVVDAFLITRSAAEVLFIQLHCTMQQRGLKLRPSASGSHVQLSWRSSLLCQRAWRGQLTRSPCWSRTSGTSLAATSTEESDRMFLL